MTWMWILEASLFSHQYRPSDPHPHQKNHFPLFHSLISDPEARLVRLLVEAKSWAFHLIHRDFHGDAYELIYDASFC